MPYQRSRMLACILNLISGFGHLYWGRKVKGTAYLILMFGGLLFGTIASIFAQSEELILFTLICAAILWGISMLDLLITMLRDPQVPSGGYDPGIPHAHGGMEQEKFFTILLSFVPGLGHFQLGLMQRGLSFLISFFGVITMMFFITGITGESVFLLLLGLLPIIWLYCMFDVVQLVHRKQAGELLLDRSLLDEWELGRVEGRRSKVLATLLSAFPGAGQMYLGLQKRGLQMMVLFLGSFYIIDVLRLSVFLFVIPVIWFYCFFDGLQQTSRYGILPLEDQPLMNMQGRYQHWLGIVLIVLGIYFIGMELLVPWLDSWFPELRLYFRIDQYLRPFIVSVLLIGGGIKLLTNHKRQGRSRYDENL
ncbi:hypothetical protein [Paenibacillus sanguinis]|uniref:hypothetical protein n=1 Tax=Paenibacillus sanguinis TaxID=225906 RepID=UPI00036C7AA0|nr:hypothetical protein [Paenibacillus sanguinis]